MKLLVGFHMLSGLTGIIAGLIVVVGIFVGKRMSKCVAVFMLATIAACISGFYFLPVDGFTSAQVVGVFCSALLGFAGYAFYIQHLAGSWNQIYTVAAVEALYLNVLIAIAQSFQHLKFLQDLAPTQSSPIYVAVKLSALLLFVAIAYLAARRAVPVATTVLREPQDSDPRRQNRE
jgi:hypothetical protein